MPPGFVYLAGWLPTLAGPPALTYLLAWIARSFGEGQPLPDWALRTAVVLSLPVVYTVKVQWRYFRVAREARRMGAVLPPTHHDALPGGLSFLLNSPKEFRVGYPGTEA